MKDNHKADVSHTDEFDRMYQEIVKQAEDKYKVKSEHLKTEEEIGLVDNLSSRWVNEFELPNGYIFKDENGNVIYANKIILEKKKKEYPKTYEECCKIMGIEVADLLIWDNMLDPPETIYYNNLERLLHSFRKLLICRDAYWKIAGDWKPEYPFNTARYVISNAKGFVGKVLTYDVKNYILEFPTEEMRDAFYENFKKDIEICKELL